MEFKSHAQADVIAHLNALNKQLGIARNDFLSKKAEKDHFEHNLVKTSPGKSHAEKTMNAKASEEWLAFQKELGRLDSIHHFLKLQFQILSYEYLSQYQETKFNEGLINKQG